MSFLSPFMFFIAVASTGLCIFSFIVLGNIIAGMVEAEDRTYMDPLPPMLKLVWPFIQVIAYFGASFLPYEILEAVDRKLQRTGVSFLLTAEQFVGVQVFSVIVWPLIAIFMMGALKYQGEWGAFIVLGAILLGIAHPNLWLSDNRKRRENAIIRGMPTYLDFITMCVEAGLNFQGALQQAMEKAPASPLKNEFSIVLRDLRAGLSRSDALRRMADRLDIQETTSFVSAVIQAERMGSSMATVMRVQAEQRRNERFQRAEKMAMEAPIKLVGPLILFIFPVTFIILGFPIAMKFLNEGIL